MPVLPVQLQARFLSGRSLYEEVIRDGDFIRWGLRADALSSRVQIER